MKTPIDFIKEHSPTPDAGYDTSWIITAMEEYAKYKVKEQRDLMRVYLANHFNMRNVPKPEFQ